jgi:cell fate (sporulation/competence/biofilm development) regulator YlbF (YheA/YmcA/DUF963 family)
MLIEELQVTARSLGEALRTSDVVQKYLSVQADCEADPETADLESRMRTLYEVLLARQQRGENLERSEIDAFNALKRQVYQLPRIAEREAALTPVKGYFAEIADEINLSLGVEFSTLAQAGRV